MQHNDVVMRGSLELWTVANKADEALICQEVAVVIVLAVDRLLLTLQPHTEMLQVAALGSQ